MADTWFMPDRVSPSRNGSRIPGQLGEGRDAPSPYSYVGGQTFRLLHSSLIVGFWLMCFSPPQEMWALLAGLGRLPLWAHREAPKGDCLAGCRMLWLQDVAAFLG